MMNYFDLTVNSRAILMTSLFILSCFSAVGFLTVIRKRRLVPKLLLPLCSAVCGIYTVFFATEVRVAKFSRELPDAVRAVCELPVILCVSVILLCFGYNAFVVFTELRVKRTRLSRISVKESLDMLPTGLCFYRDNGRTVLVNNSMNRLCHQTVGRDLQNAKLFWEILSEGDVLPEVERLSSGDHPSFRYADGRVWSFSRTQLDGVIQLVAADTTEISNVNAELEQGNLELAAVNARLRAYGDRVDDLTRSRERIDIKANIHRELGQAILITRRYILDTAHDPSASVAIWKKNVAMLTREAEFISDETPLWNFLDSAKESGVEVVITGELPEDAKQNGLCVTAAVECLVNGVRHADAHTLYITVTESDTEVSVTYENDGALPTGEIVEGGGLSSLRHRANRLGGRTEVRSDPRFSFILILPNKKNTADA